MRTKEELKADRLKELKDRLNGLEGMMAHSFTQARNRDRELFLVSREIENIEDPESYERNKSHWEGHQIRM